MIYKSATFTKTIIYLYFLDNIKIQFGSELKSLIKGHFRRYSVKQSTFFIVIYKEFGMFDVRGLMPKWVQPRVK